MFGSVGSRALKRILDRNRFRQQFGPGIGTFLTFYKYRFFDDFSYLFFSYFFCFLYLFLHLFLCLHVLFYFFSLFSYILFYCLFSFFLILSHSLFFLFLFFLFFEHYYLHFPSRKCHYVTYIHALPRTVLRREKGRMEMAERMGDGARDHECANERVLANERGKEKKRKGTRRSLDSPRCSLRCRSVGMSSRATIADSNGGARPREKHAVKNDNVEARRRYTTCASHTSPKSPRTGEQYQRA